MNWSARLKSFHFELPCSEKRSFVIWNVNPAEPQVHLTSVQFSSVQSRITRTQATSKRKIRPQGDEVADGQMGPKAQGESTRWKGIIQTRV